MTQKEKRVRRKVVEKSEPLPFTKENYLLFAVGLIIMILGYIALGRKPWDSFWSLTLAPILLVLSYVVIIPIAIMYQKKNRDQKEKSS